MTIRVLAVGNSNTDQVDHRSLIAALTQPRSNTKQRAGLFNSKFSPASVSNVSAMEMGIGPFRGIVSNDDGGGDYLVQSDATATVTFDPGEASVTRTDQVIVRVYNNDQDGSGSYEPVVEYLKGDLTGAAAPLPNNSLLLWEVSVPAGASAGTGGIDFVSIAESKRVYTTAVGGVLLCADNDEILAIENPFDGMVVYDKQFDILYSYNNNTWHAISQISMQNSLFFPNILNEYNGLTAFSRDENILYMYNGTEWLPVGGRAEWGTQIVDATAGSFTTYPIVFSTPFKNPPHINLTKVDNGRPSLQAQDVTTTGFTLAVDNFTGGGALGVTIAWEAREKV